MARCVFGKEVYEECPVIEGLVPKGPISIEDLVPYCQICPYLKNFNPKPKGEIKGERVKSPLRR